MQIPCDNNNTICKTSSNVKTKGTNTVVGFILGSIACLVFVILIIVFIYMLCCKRRCRSRCQCRSRSNSTVENSGQSINTDHNQQQQQQQQQQPSQLDLRSSFNEPPPSYQEANRDNNLNKTINRY